MSFPKVTTSLANGNLGRVAPSDDGICGLIATGVAVGGQFALGDILGPFTSLQDAEDKGIDEAYDSTNTCMAWRHIKDFYDQAGNGTKLYVMIVAKTVTMTQMCDKANNYVKKLVSQTGGNIRMVGVTRIPDGGYSPTFSEQFEQDLMDAITKADELIGEERDLYRPISIIIEGRNFQGTASSARDMRHASTGPNANRVAIMIGSDYDVSSAASHANKYAAVGYALGRAAGIPVQRNIGRVKDGDVGITQAGFSNNAKAETLTEAQQETLHDRGYIFFRKHTGKAGYFFNDDPVTAPITSDYSSLSAGRTMDKAARITRAVYLEELLDDLMLDPDTGKLDPSVAKNYESIVEDEINRQMTAQGEIVRVSVYVDPDQNVVEQDKVTAEVNIRRKGMSKEIVATLAFEAPEV